MNLTLQDHDIKVMLEILVARWRTCLAKLVEVGGSAFTRQGWADKADAARRIIWTVNEQTGVRPFLFPGEAEKLGLKP